MMRTTLNIPDDVVDIIRAVAEARDISLGDAVAELVRKGLRPEERIGQDGAFPCFLVDSGAQPITLEHTRAVEDEL